MSKILIFDKGGRNQRISLIKKNKAPKDFFQSIDFLRSRNFNIDHFSSSIQYKRNLLAFIFRPFEEIFSIFSKIGIRPLSVFQFKEKINNADYVVSLTDGFSLSLGFYYSFLNKKSKIKLAGGFHKLSDFLDKLPFLLKKFYYPIFKVILKRLDYLIFYGEADRLNSVKYFELDEEKTFTIKFGVDTDFWIPNKKNNLKSNYIFSIGQDPSRDFNTLLKVKTKRKIHIHTNLLYSSNNKKLKITNGTYQKYKNCYSDLKIRKLYQDSFLIIVPLKNVFQPSGYSVTLQAMSCGKPVILTKTKGLWAPDVFVSLKNCILVNPYNPKEIENAIKFLENNKKIYERICLNARKTVEKYFSLDIANKSTLKIFKNFK